MTIIVVLIVIKIGFIGFRSGRQPITERIARVIVSGVSKKRRRLRLGRVNALKGIPQNNRRRKDFGRKRQHKHEWKAYTYEDNERDGWKYQSIECQCGASFGREVSFYVGPRTKKFRRNSEILHTSVDVLDDQEVDSEGVSGSAGQADLESKSEGVGNSDS